jgi:hypothetical protein
MENVFWAQFTFCVSVVMVEVIKVANEPHKKCYAVLAIPADPSGRAV